MLLLSVVSASPFPPLPNAEQAVIAPEKLRDYVLNAAHPTGGPKARVFAAVLGFTGDDWPELRDQLLAGVTACPATQRAVTAWGRLYEVTVSVTGQGQRLARVRTGWIIRPDDPRPHLVTCYVDLS